MGHNELGYLPSSARWRIVAGLLAAPRLDVPTVASATVKAAERRLVELRGDPSLTYCFWLLVRMAEAARGPDFVEATAQLGITVHPDDAALALIARTADRARVELNRYPESGPFGEIASLALRRALTETVGTESRSLFGSSLEDLEHVRRQTAIRLDAVRFAADLGIRPDALRAEAAVLAARFQAVPATG